MLPEPPQALQAIGWATLAAGFLITAARDLHRPKGTAMPRYVAVQVPGRINTSQGPITCPTDGNTTGHQVAGELGTSAEITCSAGHDVPVPNGVDGREVLAAVDSADSRSRGRW